MLASQWTPLLDTKRLESNGMKDANLKAYPNLSNVHMGNPRVGAYCRQSDNWQTCCPLSKKFTTAQCNKYEMIQEGGKNTVTDTIFPNEMVIGRFPDTALLSPDHL